MTTKILKMVVFERIAKKVASKIALPVRRRYSILNYQRNSDVSLHRHFIKHFSGNTRDFGQNRNPDSTVRFLDGLPNEFQAVHRELFPSNGHTPAPSKNPADSDFLKMRYLKLQRAATRIDVRIQKKDDIKELEKMIEEAKRLDDMEIISMASADLAKCQEELLVLEEQILDILSPDEGTDVTEVILEVNAGIGGQEAMLFAAEIYQMYENYAGFRGWSFTELNYDKSDIGGIRSARAEISGNGSFNFMKFEGGVHRVQRVPKTEKFGRLQTSTTTVAVLPKPSDIDIVLRKSDLKIETCRSTGAGGQHVNKTDSAVRVIHLPTGAAVECQEERDQIENKKRAMERLAALLYQRQLDAQVEKQSSSRRIQTGSSARSDKIRTYNFPQDRLTDHRLNQNFHNLAELMKGLETFHQLGEKILKEHKREAVEEMISSTDQPENNSTKTPA